MKVVKMMRTVKVIVDILFVSLFLLITFFGIGPLLFADGSDRERLIGSLVVFLIYGVWFIILRMWRKKSKEMLSK
jgi:hypothetical protein